MDPIKTKQIIDKYWESWWIEGLSEFIKVPNLTTMVDKEYLTNGLVWRAIELVDTYINKIEI